MDEGRRLLILAAVVALAAGCGKRSGTSEDKPAPVPPTPAPAPRDVSCDEAGRHWADYLHNNVASARQTPDWREVAKDLREMCERDPFSPEERACWAAITDMASHQACLDLRAKRK